MKIYITRHGETQWNIAGRFQGWQNSNLTEKGVENAKKLGESLKNIDFDCIYCSPLGRAIETAECIRGDKNTEIITMDSLKEMGFGIWEGMEHSKIQELYSTEQYNFWNEPQLYVPINGETFEDLIHRTTEMLNQVISSGTKENVLIVTHAAVIKAIYMIVKKVSLENFWKPPFINDTCLTIIEVKNNKLDMVLEADISHLS